MAFHQLEGHSIRSCRLAACSTLIGRRSFFDAHQLDKEDERSVWRDYAPGAACPVADTCGNNQRGLIANVEFRDAFVPAFDDSASAERKFKWLAVIERAVKLHPAAKQTGIVDYDSFALLRPPAGSMLRDDVCQSGCSRDAGLLDFWWRRWLGLRATSCTTTPARRA